MQAALRQPWSWRTGTYRVLGEVFEKNLLLLSLKSATEKAYIVVEYKTPPATSWCIVEEYKRGLSPIKKTLGKTAKIR